MMKKYPTILLHEYLRELERAHIEKAKRLEEFEHERKWKIVETKKGFELQNRETGETFITVPFFKEDFRERKEKR